MQLCIYISDYQLFWLSLIEPNVTVITEPPYTSAWMINCIWSSSSYHWMMYITLDYNKCFTNKHYCLQSYWQFLFTELKPFSCTCNPNLLLTWFYLVCINHHLAKQEKFIPREKTCLFIILPWYMTLRTMGRDSAVEQVLELFSCSDQHH